MVRAVKDRGFEVDHRVAGEEAAHARVLDPLFDGWYELSRNRPAEDVVFELEIAPAGKGLNPDLAVSELAVTAGLLLVTAMGPGCTVSFHGRMRGGLRMPRRQIGV